MKYYVKSTMPKYGHGFFIAQGLAYLTKVWETFYRCIKLEANIW